MVVLRYYNAVSYIESKVSVVGYTIDDMSYVLGILVDEGVDFVVIGDTVVQLTLRRRIFEGDIDVFALEPSPLAEEERYIAIAEKHGWEYGSTEIGTPRLIAHARSGVEIIVEIYENFMDIEIPDEIIAEAHTINLKGVKIKLIKPEHYFVLKARQGVDLDKLSMYLKELKGLNVKIILKTIKLYPRNEQEYIINRLKNIGLNI